MGIIGRLLLGRRLRRLQRFLPTDAATQWLAKKHNQLFVAMFGFDVAAEIMVRDTADEQTYTEIENSIQSLRRLRTALVQEPPRPLRVVCS